MERSGTLYDAITYSLLNDLGWFEHIADWMASQLPSHRDTILEIAPILIACLYALILCLLSAIGHRICFLVPPLFLIALLYFGVENHALQHGYIAFALLTLTVWRFFYKAWRVPKEEASLTAYYHAQQHVTASNPRSSLNINLLLLITIAILYALSGDTIRVHITPFLPVVLVIVCSTTIPGVGGNSSIGIIYLLIIVLLSYVAVPDPFHMFLRNIRDITASPDPPAHGNTLYTTISQAFSPSGTTFYGLGINYGEITSTLRFLFGRFFGAMMVIDDLLGPREQINSASNANRRNPSPLSVRGLAPILKESWIIPVGLQVAFDLFIGDLIAVIITTLCLFIAWSIYDKFLGALWQTRGEWSTLTNLRSDTQANPGSGPAEGRVFILAVVTSICVLLFSYKLGVNAVIGGFILIAVLVQSERLLLLGFSIVTFNLCSLCFVLKYDHPVTGPITKTSVAAFTPGLGENSSDGPGMPFIPPAPPPPPPEPSTQ